MLCRNVRNSTYAGNLEAVQSFRWGLLLQDQGPEGLAPPVQVLLEVLVKVLLEILSQGRLREKNEHN